MDPKSGLKNLPKDLCAVLDKTGITSLYPPQQEAIDKGILSDKNFILSMPTASGKTLIAELVMLKILFEKKGKCLYVVPLRALATEKFEEFQDKYAYLGIKIGIASGDFDKVDPAFFQKDILIATSEKVDSLLRQNALSLCSSLACLVLDEIHLIGDEHRGATLEIITTRLLSINPALKVLGLSATIANASSLAKWLNAELIYSSWRPVVLKEGVYCQGEIKFADGSTRSLAQIDISDDIAKIAVDCILDKGQVLVFVTTRKSAQAEARRIAKQIALSLDVQEKRDLNQIAKKLEDAKGETTKLLKQLSECIRCGVSFHHAGLNHLQRKLIEDNFKNNLIKVVCATPTLAVGVNLPSRRTIIRGLYRYALGRGMQPVSVLDYKQMSGRAGRPKYDTFGEAILVAKSEQERSDLFCDFIFAEPEPVNSNLGNENTLRFHLLAAIASGFIASISGAISFIKKTFFSHQENNLDMTELIEGIIEFLEIEEMVTKKSGKLVPTAFGTRISRLYINPITAVIIRNCLENLQIKLEPLSILYLITVVPDMTNLNLKKSDLELILPFADTYKQEFEFAQVFGADYNTHLARIKTVYLISRWIEEEKEELLCNTFDIGPGDIYRLIDTAEWILYATAQLAELFGRKRIKPLHELITRVRYGVKPELLELVNLKGIGRIRARNLFRRGYKTINDLKSANLTELAKTSNIGKETAQNIKAQLANF